MPISGKAMAEHKWVHTSGHRNPELHKSWPTGAALRRPSRHTGRRLPHSCSEPPPPPPTWRRSSPSQFPKATHCRKGGGQRPSSTMQRMHQLTGISTSPNLAVRPQPARPLVHSTTISVVEPSHGPRATTLMETGTLWRLGFFTGPGRARAPRITKTQLHQHGVPGSMGASGRSQSRKANLARSSLPHETTDDLEVVIPEARSGQAQSASTSAAHGGCRRRTFLAETCATTTCRKTSGLLSKVALAGKV